MKSAKFSGGTAVSSAKANGFWLPSVLPNKPTAFLRIAYSLPMLGKSDVIW